MKFKKMGEIYHKEFCGMTQSISVSETREFYRFCLRRVTCYNCLLRKNFPHIQRRELKNSLEICAGVYLFLSEELLLRDI